MAQTRLKKPSSSPRKTTLSQMELNRFDPTRYLWLGASTLALSWPVVIYCSFIDPELPARMHQAAALTAIEALVHALVIVDAHLLTAKHVDYERRGVDPLVRAEMTHWALDCAASIEYSVCACCFLGGVGVRTFWRAREDSRNRRS